MNQLEKNCYNKYLAVSRSLQNKPFSLRKDFDKFEESKDYPYVHRLSSFFQRFPQVDHQLYFEAPFKIYPDEKYFDLKFYTSQRAIKTYSIYMKQLQDQMPDSEIQLEFIKKSLRFIAKFCFDNKIKLDEYITFKPANTFSWTKHLKNHEISIYVLFGFDKLQEVINTIPLDEQRLMLGSNIDDFWKYKTRFHKTVKAKQLVIEGLHRVNKILS